MLLNCLCAPIRHRLLFLDRSLTEFVCFVLLALQQETCIIKIKKYVGVSVMHVEGQHQNIVEACCVSAYEGSAQKMVVRDDVIIIENRRNMGIQNGMSME